MFSVRNMLIFICRVVCLMACCLTCMTISSDMREYNKKMGLHSRSIDIINATALALYAPFLVENFYSKRTLLFNLKSLLVILAPVGIMLVTYFIAKLIITRQTNKHQCETEIGNLRMVRLGTVCYLLFFATMFLALAVLDKHRYIFRRFLFGRPIAIKLAGILLIGIIIYLPSILLYVYDLMQGRHGKVYDIINRNTILYSYVGVLFVSSVGFSIMNSAVYRGYFKIALASSLFISGPSILAIIFDVVCLQCVISRTRDRREDILSHYGLVAIVHTCARIVFFACSIIGMVYATQNWGKRFHRLFLSKADTLYLIYTLAHLAILFLCLRDFDEACAKYWNFTTVDGKVKRIPLIVKGMLMIFVFLMISVWFKLQSVADFAFITDCYGCVMSIVFTILLLVVRLQYRRR